jgi:hypothetical protein
MEKNIQLRGSTALSGKVEKLHAFVILNTERLKAYRAKVEAVNRLDMAKELRDRAAKEGQLLAEEVFYAEAKLGTLLKNLSILRGKKGIGYAGRTLTELGITKRESFEAQKLANHLSIIKEVIEESRKKGYVPYKKSILRRIDGQKISLVKKDRPISGNGKSLGKIIPYENYQIINIKPGVWGIFSKLNIVKSEKEAKELIKSVMSCNPDEAIKSEEFRRTESIIRSCIRKKEAGEEKDIKNCYYGCPYAEPPKSMKGN